MMRSWFSGIFGFFFSRAAIAIASFAFVVLLLLLPFFKSQLFHMVENQGQTFGNSTIAATTTNLYTESYGEVIELLNKVLKDTQNILFVVITNPKGDEIVITKDNWYQSNNQYRFSALDLGAKDYVLSYQEKNVVTHTKCFMYHQKILIGGAPWGVLSVGMSDDQYQFIKDRYTLIVGSISLVLVVLLLLLFYSSSNRIRAQIASLEQTGQKLQTGNLGARALEDGIGEIGTLSRAINTMAINLQTQTNSSKQLAQIVKQTKDAFILFDNQLNILFVNDAIEPETGYAASYFIGMHLLDFTEVLNLDSAELLKEIEWVTVNHQHTSTRDTVIENKAKEKLDVEMRLELIESDERETNFLLVLSNISARKQLEKELHQLAYYDKLTDLPNRRMFMDKLRNLVKASKKTNKEFALFFIDLDNFKYINDTLGHEAGDEFLVMVGNRLREIFRAEDMVARLGGDEFTVLVQGLKSTDEQTMMNLANKMISELSARPILVSGRQLNVAASVGIAQFPRDAKDSDSLLRNADTAMYIAKRNGKNRYAFFSEKMADVLTQRIKLESFLKHALKLNDQIYLNYQPIINLQTNAIVGVEALARWMHPEKGFISPIEFVSIAEKSDLIIQLSDYLLDRAFSQAAIWQKVNPGLYVSVNISVRHFETQGFISKIKALIAKYAINPQGILMEFTESIMLDSTNETFLKFEKLKSLGFRIAIDDFGTGYSSLGYIHKFPIDVIKIDRSFVTAMIHNDKSNAIVTAIAKLSGSLGIKTIAEGVELVDQAERLKEMHCDFGQGYLYSKAVSPEEIEAMCQTQNQNDIGLVATN